MVGNTGFRRCWADRYTVPYGSRSEGNRFFSQRLPRTIPERRGKLNLHLAAWRMCRRGRWAMTRWGTSVYLDLQMCGIMNSVMQGIMAFGVALIALLAAALDFQENSITDLGQNAQSRTSFNAVKKGPLNPIYGQLDYPARPTFADGLGEQLGHVDEYHADFFGRKSPQRSSRRSASSYRWMCALLRWNDLHILSVL